jgi:diguanylate cyclase (GGDEF)-like protein/PAS domain S-box-containing protein
MNPYRWSDLPKVTAFAVLYIALAKIVLGFFSANGIVSVVWPPSGLALAALLIGGYRYWPAIFICELIVHASDPGALGVNVAVASSNALEAVIGVWLLNRSGYFDSKLSRPLDYVLLTACGAFSALLCAAFFSSALLFFGLLDQQSFARNLLDEWLGDTLGVILVAPLVLVWQTLPRDWLQRGRILEAAACFGLAFLAGQVIFVGWAPGPLGQLTRGYWMFLLVVWGAVRFGRHGALLIIAMTAVQALVGTIHKTGLFANDLVRGGMLNFWFYMLALTTVGVLLALIMKERELANARALRRSKLYKALSETNQAIVRMEKQDDLFPQACRSAVTFGGMKMAWVGLLDEASGRIAPVAVYGEGKEYVEGLTLSSRADLPEGCGPTGTALRESRPVIVEDYGCNPATTPWQNRATEFGWNSAAAYPIPRGGRPFAVLTIYHGDRNAFDAEATALFGEMSHDIAFALDNFDRETQRQLAEESARLAASVYNASSEAMMVTDADNRIIAINPAFTTITGYVLDEVSGKSPNLLRSDRHDDAFFRNMWQELGATGQWRGEIWNRRKDGEIYPELLTINSIFNDDGSLSRRIALFSDISEQKRAEYVIRQQAYFDVLTQLPNRRLFHDRLDQQIKKAHRADEQVALLFIDLDRFKEVNDTLGHTMGDTLLLEAATRIIGCVREADTVARLGGDEFTVILAEMDEPTKVERVAQLILQRLSEPFHLANELIYVSASIGIALYPNDATDVENLLRNADQAMYAAKNAGRNRFSYFTREMQVAAQARLRMVSDLRNALADDELQLYFQPIVDLRNGHIRKAEALIRWLHPKKGMISPADFIPLAEETGMIVEIGDWVFHQAAQQAMEWRATHDAAMQISVNVSPVQFFSERSNHALWFDHLRLLGLSGDGIVVEITEGLLMDATEAITGQLGAFHHAGIQVSLDDFGTGYSSLAYLKRFDIDFLKIDQSFVRNLAPGSDDMALCEAIIGMAHKLGIKVIAEGIETAEQRDLLAAAGCDYGQGYLFSRPVPAAEFGKLFASEPVCT